MCEVLPTIDEAASPSPDGENTKLEQLMISMLEERDKLMENLRESQEAYNESTKKLSDVENDNKVLMRQLQALMPEEEDRLHAMLDELRKNDGTLTNSLHDDLNRWPIAYKFAALARELGAAQEKMKEKDEEINELKSERHNTRLLLEHLECLVARHERSLRMTVVKRQTSSAGVSSEVEVLKALKSLFDHHKALDEKVRERLRTAQDRIIVLEDELMLANQEIKSLHDGNKRMKRLIQQRNSVRLSMCYDNVSFTKEQLALLEDREQTIGDLQFSLDERTAQLEEAIHMRDEMADKVQEMEEQLAMSLNEVKRLKNAHKHMNETISDNSKLETKLSDVQSQLAETDLELATMRDLNEQLSEEVTTNESKLKKLEEESSSVRFELKQKSVALQQAQSRISELTRVRDEQLFEAVEKQGSAQHTILELKKKLDMEMQELAAVRERESINEKNVNQLQSTVDRMYSEARERQKTYSMEKKQLLDEKAKIQHKMESLQSELSSLKEKNAKLEDQVKKLQKQLKNIKSTGNNDKLRSKALRFSLHETDLDAALAGHSIDISAEPVESAMTAVGVASENDDIIKDDTRESGGSDSWDVSQLVSMLESQVSRLDKQLESMGAENMEEADEFDRVIQSVAEGNYHPSAEMETFPHSTGPVPRNSKRKLQKDLPMTARFRVNLPPDIPEDQQQYSPASTTSSSDSLTGSGSNISQKSKSSSLKHRSSFSKLFRRSRGTSHKKNSARRSSEPVFRTATTSVGDTSRMRESVDFSDLLESSDEREESRKRKGELLTSVLAKGTPFSRWDSSTVIAWLEVWVGVPFWYIAAIRNCLQSGEMLANITETELEQELGITNTLHRLKLRLAVQEIVSLTSSAKPHRATSLFGEMAHDWIADYWLPSLGLPQYKEVFKVCLVDARMLEHLTKKDLRTALKMVDASHRNSLQYGISMLKKLDYNRRELEERRNQVMVSNKKDVLVWSNDHMIQWVESLGLTEFGTNLRESGVHGGVVAMDNDYNYEKLALALQIPLASVDVRRQLRNEFNTLLSEGTNRSSGESQSHGKIVRKLSKRLKVSSRRIAGPTDFIPIQNVRPPSPVLYSANPAPLHLHSLLEQSDSNSSGNTTTPTSTTANTVPELSTEPPVELSV